MTLLNNLVDAGLPILYASEDGNSISWRNIPTDEQMQLCRDIVLQYIDPTAYSDVQQGRLDNQQFKDEYLTSINQLQTIETTPDPTQLNLATLIQMARAIKFIAKTLRLLLKLLARRL